MKNFRIIRELSTVNFLKATPNELKSVNPRVEIHFTASEPDGHFAKQTHSNLVIEAGLATQPDTNTRIEADGLYTCTAELKLSVQTADCLPVLLWNHGECAAIHAGWRGLTANILNKYLEGREAFGYKALLGPCISGQSYEVGTDVIEAFIEKNKLLTEADITTCISKGNYKKWFLDLRIAAALSLIRLGVEPANIFVTEDCTYLSHNWPSYRRQGKSS